MEFSRQSSQKDFNEEFEKQNNENGFRKGDEK